jgi:hypothetical protein
MRLSPPPDTTPSRDVVICGRVIFGFTVTPESIASRLARDCLDRGHVDDAFKCFVGCYVATLVRMMTILAARRAACSLGPRRPVMTLRETLTVVRPEDTEYVRLRLLGASADTAREDAPVLAWWHEHLGATTLTEPLTH